MTELMVNGISGKTEQGRLIVEECIGLGGSLLAKVAKRPESSSSRT